VNQVRSLFGVLLLLLTIQTMAADLPTARPESVGMSSTRLAGLTTGMKELIDSKIINGDVIAVARDGKVVYFEAAGQRDVEKSAPMTKDTIFRLYSMTKPITGVAMMMLYEQGKWDLGDPVSKYIPEFKDLKVAKVDPMSGEMTEVPANHPMTMRELMSHTSGLTDASGKTAVDEMYIKDKVFDTSKPMQVMIDKLAKIPLLFQPGERWHYSYGTDVQGYLVEKLSGQSLPEFFKNRIFVPLGMKDTAFYVPKEKRNRFAVFYNRDKDGKLVPMPGIAEHLEPPVLPSGGEGLVSTVADYTRFCQMLLNGGELDGVRLLSPLSVKLMRANGLPSSAREIDPDGGWGFGIDFGILEKPAQAWGYSSEGTIFWGSYAGSMFWIDPVYKLVVVVMTQQLFSDMPDVMSRAHALAYQAIIKE
jgi:CubicO group peptidase (beta-lactamase class C family)